MQSQKLLRLLQKYRIQLSWKYKYGGMRTDKFCPQKSFKFNNLHVSNYVHEISDTFSGWPECKCKKKVMNFDCIFMNLNVFQACNICCNINDSKLCTSFLISVPTTINSYPNFLWQIVTFSRKPPNFNQICCITFINLVITKDDT